MSTLNAPAADRPTIFTTTWCGYCKRLKSQLDRAGVAYDEVNIEEVPDGAALVQKANGGNETRADGVVRRRLDPDQPLRPAGPGQAGVSRLPAWTGVRAVVLDIDGTLVDSAEGIVAGFRHALTAVGVPVPSDATLASDLGPPLTVLLPAHGVPPERLDEAVAAYRAFYLREGLQRATPYDGVADVLTGLAGRYLLGTATAKRTDTARATLEAHGLASAFGVVNGLADDHPDKAATLAQTLELLGGVDPAAAVMVGDRALRRRGRACRRDADRRRAVGLRQPCRARGGRRRRAARAPAPAAGAAARLTGSTARPQTYPARSVHRAVLVGGRP